MAAIFKVSNDFKSKLALKGNRHLNLRMSLNGCNFFKALTINTLCLTFKYFELLTSNKDSIFTMSAVVKYRTCSSKNCLSHSL